MNVYKKIQENCRSGKKQLAVLIDPDKWILNDDFSNLLQKYQQSKIDFFFVGGSIVDENHFRKCIECMAPQTDIPIVLFPGAHYQIHRQADAILFLSLVSGRNADYLIEHQVKASQAIQQMQLETIATGYLLIDGEQQSSTAKVTNTTPIARNNIDLCLSTALAAKMLGMQLIYLEAGSGAAKTVPLEMIQRVKKEVGLPLIVGGGIKSAQEVSAIFDAGADLIVIGNALEKNPELLKGIINL